MSQILSQMKLFKPVLRSSLVPRLRLIEKLDKGFTGKMTLISAPAGFGKTTAATNWLSQLQRPLGWLSLDEDDNDPHRFFTYVKAALAPMTGTRESHQTFPALSVKAMTTLLLNNLLELSEPGVLVLDDYHLIETESIHEAMAFLCTQLPPALHLVLITRSDPPLPLARMRARGELNELRQKDLRFTLEETAVFLTEIMGLTLTGENVAALEARTEGWIASLQLVALSLQETSDATQIIDAFSGTHRYIVDYLVEEVLAQCPAETREFLLKTSLLNRLSASLCDEVLADSQSQDTLERLETANFFLIPLDDERGWYRYHHLFADVLRQRAAQAYPDQLSGLYQRASQWYQSPGFLHDAIEMELAGADYSQAAALIIQAAETVTWEQGEWLLLDRWLSILPEALIKKQPRLCLYQGFGFRVRGQYVAGNARLADAERAILIAPEENQLAQGELAAIRSTIARFQGNHSQVLAHAEIALTHLPPAGNAWRVMTLLNLGATHFLRDEQEEAARTLTEVWQLAQVEKQVIWGCVSVSFLAQLLVRQGRYHDATHLYQQGLALALPQRSAIYNIGMIYVGLGELWLAQNDLVKAEDFLQKGLDAGTTAQNKLLVLSGSLSLARLRQIQGSFEAASALILQAQNMAQNSESSWSWVHVPVAAFLIRAWVKQGVLSEAKRLLETAMADASHQPRLWIESLTIAQIHLLLAEERWPEAGELLATLWEASADHHRLQSQIEIRVLQAVVHQQTRQPDLALAYLEDALLLAQPSGDIRIFLDQGQPIQILLAASHFDDAVMTMYAQRISDSFPDRPNTQPEQIIQQLIEPLTTRELELLALIATGTTNREIAGQLFISYGTVRRHLNNIYGKLGVNDRTQAILKAQELNLV